MAEAISCMRALPAGCATIHRADTMPYRIAITPAPIASHSARSVVILWSSRLADSWPFAALHGRLGRRCTAKKARDYTTKGDLGFRRRPGDRTTHGTEAGGPRGRCNPPDAVVQGSSPVPESAKLEPGTGAPAADSLQSADPTVG